MSYSQDNPGTESGAAFFGAGERAQQIATLQQTNQILMEMLRDYNTGRAGLSYQHVNAAGTYVIKAAAGTLMSVNLNSPGTAAATSTIYDASGTAGIAGSVEVAVLSFGTGATPAMVPFGPEGLGLALNNGLVVVATANADITFGFR